MSNHAFSSTLGILALGGVVTVASAPAQMPSDQPPPAAILRDMVGMWNVEQRMWTGPNASPTDKDAFTRTSFINHNVVDGIFEYFSIDSRAPQQMHYRSAPLRSDHRGPFQFKGGTFVAAQWGEQRNVEFAYRVRLSAVTDQRQRLMLHLTPTRGAAKREFTAFEYRYTRRR